MFDVVHGWPAERTVAVLDGAAAEQVASRGADLVRVPHGRPAQTLPGALIEP
jgi:hypothetical protein